MRPGGSGRGGRHHHHGGRGGYGIGYIGVPLMAEEVVYESDISPNALYKKYRKWYFETHGNSFDGVMSFKEWIKWAKARGVVSADGDTVEVQQVPGASSQDSELNEKQKEIVQKAGSGVGKILAITAVVAAVIGFGWSFWGSTNNTKQA